MHIRGLVRSRVVAVLLGICVAPALVVVLTQVRIDGGTPWAWNALLWVGLAIVFTADGMSRRARALAVLLATYCLWRGISQMEYVNLSSGTLYGLDGVLVAALLIHLADVGWGRLEVLALGAAIPWILAYSVAEFRISSESSPSDLLTRVFIDDHRITALVLPGLLAVAMTALIVRMRRSRRLDGRTRTWLTASAVLQAVPFLTSGAYQIVMEQLSGGSSEFAQSGSTLSGMLSFALDDAGTACQSVIPLCLLVLAAGQRLRRAEAARMVVDIERPATPESVRDALRRAAADPTLEVVFQVPDTDGYVDVRGDTATHAEGRLELPVRGSDGSMLAVVRIDPHRESALPLVRSTLNAAALSLENARLHAAIRAQLAEVRASRERLVEAGLLERRRLERDLHDGVQQRLLSLGMRLTRARDDVTDAEISGSLELAHMELNLALRDLRDLARGLHPAVLSQSGLAVAIESLVERASLPVTVDVPDTRWSPAVEATAYFVVAEGLANVAKHAAARCAHVRISNGADRIEIEVGDDGAGGAQPEGKGLTGLRDRVTALGGTFSVDAQPHGGTRILASLPCG